MSATRTPCPPWCVEQHNPDHYVPDRWGCWGINHSTGVTDIPGRQAETHTDRQVALHLSVESYECESPEDAEPVRLLVSFTQVGEHGFPEEVAGVHLDMAQALDLLAVLVRHVETLVMDDVRTGRLPAEMAR